MLIHENSNSGLVVTVCTPTGCYQKPRFETKREEKAFLSFIKNETERIFKLNLSENTGKDKDQIKSELWNRHFPRWSL